MKTNSRLLGLAFASADVLMELDRDGRITFALGSAPAPGCASPETWPGRFLIDFLGKASRAAFATVIEDLADGARSPAAEVLLVCDEERVRRARIRVSFAATCTGAVLRDDLRRESIPFRGASGTAASQR